MIHRFTHRFVGTSNVRAASAPVLTTLALLAAAPAMAQGESITVALRGSYVESIQSNGQTVPHEDLTPGISAAEILDHPWGGTVRNADGRNLESYFIRNGTSGNWEITLPAGWTPGSGSAADFFVFEIGGNDSFGVRPRLSNGQLGQPTQISNWSATDVVVDGGPNTGQRAHGTAFRFENLRRPNGQPLQANDTVVSLVIESGNIDGAAFLVRAPGVFAGNHGDGSHELLPAEPRALSPLEVVFRGPWASETDESPNPFLDYRFAVQFTGPGGRNVTVPGFFDAGGGRTDTGNRWVARFLPPVAGTWTARATIRTGTNEALSLNPASGTPWYPLHGKTFTFQVRGTSPAAPGFYAVGKLQDVGKHHWKFENGGYYLKAGTNSPENFLALRSTDDVTKSGGEGNLHSYEAHVGDWRLGDPVLDRFNTQDDGRGAIGALNYLSDQGVNSLFLMVMNLGGDGNDVYPFLGPRNRPFEKRHYDTSRLRQWNEIFEHAMARGISLSLVMNETEIDNELWLDGGNLGDERKLFYREMIARFGHLPAVRWNICEENDFSVAQLNAFASYVKAVDSSDHAVAIHNNPDDLALFQSLSSSPNFDAASLQFNANSAAQQVEQVREWTQAAGRPWLVDADEMGPWQTGLTDSNAVDTRKRVLYDALFSGGGVEFYFGWHDLPLGGDLSIEDFRTRHEMWGYLGHARRFMEDNLPFWDMDPRDDLVRNENSSYGGAEVYAQRGDVYAIYYPNASTRGQLNLEGFTQNFMVRWFDPRTGEFAGAPQWLGTGGGWRNIPAPPHSTGNDWVALVRERMPLTANHSVVSASASQTQHLTIDAGPALANRDYVLLSSFTPLGGTYQVGGLIVPITFDRLTRIGITDLNGTMYTNQYGTLDAQGRGMAQMRITPIAGAGLVGLTIHHCAITRNPFDWHSNVVSVQITP